MGVSPQDCWLSFSPTYSYPKVILSCNFTTSVLGKKGCHLMPNTLKGLFVSGTNVLKAHQTKILVSDVQVEIHHCWLSLLKAHIEETIPQRVYNRWECLLDPSLSRKAKLEGRLQGNLRSSKLSPQKGWGKKNTWMKKKDLLICIAAERTTQAYLWNQSASSCFVLFSLSFPKALVKFL